MVHYWFNAPENLWRKRGSVFLLLALYTCEIVLVYWSHYMALVTGKLLTVFSMALVQTYTKLLYLQGLKVGITVLKVILIGRQYVFV